MPVLAENSLVRRKRLFWLGAMVVASAGLLFVWWPHEPTYKGKTVAAWFRDFRSSKPHYWRSVPSQLLANSAGVIDFKMLDEKMWLRDPAAEGLRALGTNSAIYLASQIRDGGSRWNRWYRTTLPKLPNWARARLPPLPLQPRVNYDATIALMAVARDSAPAIPILSAGLKDPSCSQACMEALDRLAFVSVLERLGGKADPAFEELSQYKSLTHACNNIRWIRPGTPLAARILTEALSFPAVELRRRAVFELNRFGSEAAVAVLSLGRALADGDSEVRQGAAYALESLGPLAAPAAPDLVAVLKGQEQELRYLATRALRSIGTNSPLVLPALTQLTNDANAMVRTAAHRGLERFEH